MKLALPPIRDSQTARTKPRSPSKGARPEFSPRYFVVGFGPNDAPLGDDNNGSVIHQATIDGMRRSERPLGRQQVAAPGKPLPRGSLTPNRWLFCVAGASLSKVKELRPMSRSWHGYRGSLLLSAFATGSDLANDRVRRKTCDTAVVGVA